MLKNSILKKSHYIVDKKCLIPAELDYIKKCLTFTPKTHSDYQKFAPKIPIYEIVGRELRLPRFWALDKIGIPVRRELGKAEKIKLKCTFPPRDYQVECVKKLYNTLKTDTGTVLSVQCGFGKTYCGIYLATKLKKKTLILVHTSILLKQWIERINGFIDGARIGIIQGKTFDIENKDFVIAMVQTLVSKSKGFRAEQFDSFGFTIIDECHHLSAPGFSRAIPIISTRYLLGLSATPKREDGLENIFFHYIGSIGYSSNPVNTLKVDVKVVNYSSNSYREIRQWNHSLDLHKMLELIIENTKRNQFIAQLVNKLARVKGRQLLVLSTRIEHLRVMKAMTDKKLPEGITSSFYIGGMKEEELAISAKSNILFASYQLVSEGTDIPTLNTLIQCSPRKNIQQVVGRIMRAKTENNPLIFDIKDCFSIYNSQYRHRDKFYRQEKYRVDNYSVHDDDVSDYPYIFESNQEYEEVEVDDCPECVF